MKNFKLGQAAIAVAALAVATGPVIAADWTAAAQVTASSKVSVSQLSIELKAAVSQTTASLVGRNVSAAEAQAAYANALQVPHDAHHSLNVCQSGEIGRASCRERV